MISRLRNRLKPSFWVLAMGSECFLAACHPLVTQTGSPEIAQWRDFDQRVFIVTVMPTKLTIRTDQDTLAKDGVWQSYLFSTGSARKGRTIVAEELPDESLEVHMAAVHPRDHRIFVCTKIYRGLNDRQLYPPSSQFGAITYPPPKGLFQVGMLEADIPHLPWVPKQEATHGCDDPPDISFGPTTYRFRSDNAQLPELLVTAYHGKVIDVSGGAEDTDGPDYVIPKKQTWLDWFWGLIPHR